MKKISILRADTLVALLNWIGWPVLAIYLISMFIFPWFEGGFNWNYVQEVWDRWQSVNMGMLAFVSSITAFNISRYNANQQRKREFLAARAFLPSALSGLTGYFEKCASVFQTAWGAKPSEDELKLKAPVPPNDYREVFEECIRHANPNVGEYLTSILSKLQIHHSRISGFVTEFRSRDHVNPDKYNIITYLYRLGELQALVNNLFEFARGESNLLNRKLVWDDYKSVFNIWRIWMEEIYIDEKMNLEQFTKRAIDRES